MMIDVLKTDTVSLDEENNALVIIDQTRLPNEVVLLSLKRQEEIRDAIYQLKVRGAPAIGVAAAFGLYLASLELSSENHEAFFDGLEHARLYLAGARPTAVNLFWALNRMYETA
ncbi:MAG: S-methyl-5-thioribose-1-phosphate isomerase, partial [Clostridia bacterium]|nr:S-methyl-5-thioribose-1-phosphate isomerase [Clostridia bacterium]